MYRSKLCNSIENYTVQIIDEQHCGNRARGVTRTPVTAKKPKYLQVSITKAKFELYR